MDRGAPNTDVMAALDDVACGVLRTNANGVIEWANRLFCTWLGSPPHQIVGRRIQEFFTVGGRIFHQTHWVPLMQMQHSVSEVKFDLVTRDGSLLPVVMNGIRQQRDGNIVHNLAVFIARDRDKYERELMNTGERMKAVAARSVELEEVARDRALFAEEMMGIVSHDLRNPLSTIELSAKLIATGNLEPDHQAAVQRISRATSRAVRLIHDLLDFTQARLGDGLGIARVAIDVHGVMTDAVDELRSAFPGRTLLHVAEGPGQCNADPDRLTQLVGNLVTNAITYGLSDSSVTITSRSQHDGWTIAVHNKGEPIPADVLPVLFQPLARGAHNPDGSRSVGLGLYIVREIAKAHGGEVMAESTVHDGTTFTAHFPSA